MAEFKSELILQTESGQSVAIDLRNALVLSAAPTASTKARQGMQAYVLSGGAITEEYVCTAVSGSTYTWAKREVAGGKDYITPQMFGAVGDGVADDTAAIQAAFDNGGYIYFPAGRYKVTRQLTISNSCKVEMFKPYPATYQEEYPLTPDDNWMGSRIETYATDGYGVLIRDAVEIDGLFLRAMDGFAGVLLKLDTSKGIYTYQTAVRLSHIKLENDSATTIPESMFDFTPDGSYHYILNDIAIGRSPSHPRCTYGFRADLSGTPRKWCNNVFVRNMCIDMRADYPIYIDGATCAVGWVFDGLTIQAYNFDPSHTNLMVLKNLSDLLFVGSYLWDTGGVTFLNGMFATENISNVTCVGCSLDFDVIETGLSEKMKRAENLNIANLQMSVVGDDDTGTNILTLSDGKHTRTTELPSVVVDEETVGKAVGHWMDENAEPTEVIGRNKFDASSEGNTIGYYYNNGQYDSDSKMWMAHFMRVNVGDILRWSCGGNTRIIPWSIYYYDENKNFMSPSEAVYAGNSDSQDGLNIEVKREGAAYVRISFNVSQGVGFDDIPTAKLCCTINNVDVTYTPYKVTYEGGIGSYVKLQSPNGTQYTIGVNDNGELVANPVN